MDARGRLIVDIVLASLLLLVPAFLLHSDPRFAGSLAGFALGTSAAMLMVLLLIYPLTKYSRSFKALVTRLVSMKDLLGFHVYAGIAASFSCRTSQRTQVRESDRDCPHRQYVDRGGDRIRGAVLSAADRHRNSRAAKLIYQTLRSAYDRTALTLSAREMAIPDGPPVRTAALQEVPLLQLVDSISDLEYAIGSQEAVKKIFMQWIGLHVVAAIAMYALLALHIAGEVYYGLRWLT